MANFNKVILMGNLTRDPQLRVLPSQTSVVEIGLAVNHRYKTAQGEDREEVMFIDCSAFGKQAEVINQYCRKGRPLLIEGRLKFDTWEDKQGGGKRSKHRIVIDNFQLLGSRDPNAAPGDAGAAPADDAPAAPVRRPAAQNSAPPANAAPPIAEEEHFKEDDIPF